MRGQIAAFVDRADAGARLAEEIKRRRYPSPVVLALPRGGVAVGYEIARRIDAPLDVVVARKLGAPFQPELAIGAIAPGGVVVVDRSAIDYLGIKRETIEGIVEAETVEMRRREAAYHVGIDRPEIVGRTAILVDDGIATGMTAEAAILSIRRRDPGRLVLAVPVCAAETMERLRTLVDDVICLMTPQDFRAVGLWYEDFSQLTDAQVIDMLSSAHEGYGRKI